MAVNPYKNRNINKDQRVRVYRNLNKKGVWYSIKQGDKVVAHGVDFSLCDCKTIVNQKGREKVIKEQQKNVHAFIEGYLYNTEITYKDLDFSKLNFLTYNPYKNSQFVDFHSEEKVYHPSVIVFSSDKKVYYRN